MSSLLNNTYLSSINIDLISTDADTHYSDTHKLWFLNDRIIIPENTHILMGVQSFNMPYSFYMFRAGINDTFSITTDDGIEQTTQEITIDVGNYTSTQLINHMNTKFTAVKAGLGLTTLTMNVNSTTNTFFISALPLMQSITISNIKCYKELGFADENDYVFNNVSTLTFPKMYNLAGDPSLYIRLHQNPLHNINSKHVNGLLCNIPVKAMYRSYIFYEPVEIQYFKVRKSLLSVELSILDENLNDIAELNTASNWRITLTIHFSYDKPRYHPFIPRNQLTNDDEEKNEKE